jgi:hypothetical protein
MSARLAGLKKKWEAAREAYAENPDGGFNALDDGRYLARLTGADVREGNQDNLGVLFEFTIIQGESTGETTVMWCGIEDEEGMKWLMRHFKRLGVEGVGEIDIDDVEATCLALLEEAPTLRIRLKTRKSKKDGQMYQNTFIEKLVEVSNDELDEGEEEEAEGDEAEAEAEDEQEEEQEEEEEEEEQEEEEPKGGDDDGVEIAKGLRVEVNHRGKDRKGTVVSVNEKAETVSVRLDYNKKLAHFDFDELIAIDD